MFPKSATGPAAQHPHMGRNLVCIDDIPISFTHPEIYLASLVVAADVGYQLHREGHYEQPAGVISRPDHNDVLPGVWLEYKTAAGVSQDNVSLLEVVNNGVTGLAQSGTGT